MAHPLKISINFKDVEQFIDKLKKELKTAKGARAGFLKGDSSPDGATLETIAFANEFGVPQKNIPARPFFRKAMHRQKAWIIKLKQFMSEERPLVQCLARVGEVMKNDVSASINSNIPPENASATIARKGSSQTLVDTGHLRNSVHSEVIK